MGGNRHAFPYAVLDDAGIDITGLDPYHACKKAEELGLVGAEKRAIEKAQEVAENVIYRGGNPLYFERAVDLVKYCISKFNLNKLKRIETIDSIPRLEKSPAGANGGKLLITTKFLNNPSTIYSNSNDKMLSSGFTRRNVTYDDPIATVLYHEIGHIVGDQLFGLRNNQFIKSDISEEVVADRYFEVSQCYYDSISNGAIKSISERALEDEVEFFAEAFCMYMMKDKELPIDIYDMIEKVCQ